MGISLHLVPFKNEVRSLQRDAEKFYLTEYELPFSWNQSPTVSYSDDEEPDDDDEDPNRWPGNWVFREVDGVWRAIIASWAIHTRSFTPLLRI